MARTTSTTRPILVTLVVAVGIAVAWGFAAIWTMSVASELRGATANEMLYVRVDGEPFIFRTSAASAGLQQVVTLEGELATVNQQLLLYPHYTYPPGRQQGQSRDWSRGRITAANDGGAPATYWYLVHDGRVTGRAYGVGYNATTRLVTGYFSRTGFSDRMPPREEWFEIEGSEGLTPATGLIANTEPVALVNPELTLIANRRLWVIDLGARTVKAIANCQGPARLGSAWQLLDELPDTSKTNPFSAAGWIEQKILLRERKRITLVDPESGSQRTVPLPQELQTASFGVFELADGKLLLATISLANMTVPAPETALVWLDADGNVVQRKPFRLANQSGVSEREIAWMSVAAAPLLVASALFALAMQYSLVAQGSADTLADAFPRLMETLWPAIVVVAVIGLIAAVATYRRQRRFALPHAGSWAAFAFLFGVPGWLAYRFHRVWPPVAACPACNQPAPRDRVACSDCGATFSPPPRKGIEVFA